MEDISSYQFKIAKWYWTNKRKIYTLFIITFVLFDLSWLIFAGFKFITYYYSTDCHQLARDLAIQRTDYLFFHSLLGPQELIVNISHPIIANQFYDLVALAENNNSDWLVNFSYSFLDLSSSDQQVLSQGESFLLPNSEKYIFATNVSSNHSLRKVDLVIDKISWKRVRKEKDKQILRENPLLDFQFSKVSLDRFFSEKQNQSVTRLSFEIENPTVYSFWEVPLVLVVYQRTRPIGLGALSVKYLKSKEQRQVEYIWPYILPSATRVDIRPDLYILDPDVFMPLE